MTLYIIGNGFDIAHGIASQYKDFKEYAWKHGDNYQIGLLEECYPNINPQNQELELWRDLERALGNPDFQSAFEASTEDIEMEEGHEGRYQAQMEDAPEYALERMFDEFHAVYDDWVNHIDINVEPLQNLQHFDRYGRFFTFNYTETLERLYGVNRKNINYIHGRRGTEDELIVGHCNTVLADDNFSDELLVYEYEGYENIARAVNEQRKSVTDIIRKNTDYWKSLSGVNKVVVYGHSMSEVDMAYFHEIARYVANNCEWYFSIHYDNSQEKNQAVTHIKNVIAELKLNMNVCHTFRM